MKSDAPGGDRALLFGMLRFVRPHGRLLGMGALLLPLIAAVRLAGPYVLKVAIDGPIRSGELDGVAFMAFCYLALVLSQGALGLVKRTLMELLGQRIIRDIRRALFRRVTRLNQAYFDRNAMGKVLTRVTSDTESLNDFLSSGLVEIVSDSVLLVGIVVMMFVIDARLAMRALFFLPPLLIFVIAARRYLRGIFLNLSTKNARSVSYAQETIAGLLVVQAFRREEASARHYEALTGEVLDESLRGMVWSSQLSASVELASYLSIGFVVFLGAPEGVTLGVLVAFIEYIQLFYRPVEALSGRFAALQRALASAEKVFTLLDDGERFGELEGSAAAPRLEVGVRFEAVDFSYVEGAPVLSGFELEVKKGQTVAIVGATGAGKSSLIRLLLRFYEPCAGRLTWDGRDLRSFELQSLRRRIGYVPQESFLFSASLRDNIGLGVVTGAAVAEAAEAVQASRVAAELPEGLDQVVGERGRDLSAGQRQLVAFARALARDPDLLILDEATANIDGETEAAIQAALATLLEGRTAIVIAHRLSTIRAADEIIVLQRGAVIERGGHRALVAADGVYASLYRLQSGDL